MFISPIGLRAVSGQASQPDRYGLARSLARPVARGWMTLHQAYATLLNGSIQAEAEGTLEGTGLAFNDFHFRRWVLDQEIERLEVARDLAGNRIERLVWRMADAGRAQNAILAEAHNVNGAADFPLTEAEVTGAVALAQSDRRKYLNKKQSGQGVRRHG